MSVEIGEVPTIVSTLPADLLAALIAVPASGAQDSESLLIVPSRSGEAAKLSLADVLDIAMPEIFDPLENPPAEEGDAEIVIIGKRLPSFSSTGGDASTFNPPTYIRDGYWYNLLKGPQEYISIVEPPPDPAVIEIAVNVEAPTVEEQAAINAFAQAVEDTAKVVRALPDNAVITLPNGFQVSGADLKIVFNSVDFVVNPKGFVNLDGGTTGVASYINGDAVVSVNVDRLVDYNKSPGGLNYVVGHETSHLTRAGQAFIRLIGQDGVITLAEAEARERMADDIARAVAASANLPFISNPFYNFSTIDPLYFQVPNSSDSGGTGSGGGGGGGNPWTERTPE